MGHHYVPRFYLRGFAVGETIWAYDKRTNRGFSTQVKSIANETAMYSDELENHLAVEIEEPAKPAITKLRNGAPLTTDDRIALAKYIIVLWKRVPRGRERAAARLPQVAAEVSAELEAQLDQLAAEDPALTDKVEKRRAEIAEVIELQRLNPSPEIWYHSIRSHATPRVVEALLTMNWVFLFSHSHQFLTGDNPVFFFEDEGIGGPTSELTIPLSSSIALWATRQARPSMRYLRALPSGVKEINRRTAYNSSRFVYAQSDEPWIPSFIGKRHWRLTRLR